MTELVSIGEGVAAWISEDGTANAAVVLDDDGITIVDTLVTPYRAEALAQSCDALGLPIRRVVATSSHIEYVGGSGLFRLPAIYGTAQISAHLDQPPNIDGYRRQFPDLANEFGDLQTRQVTHTVTEPAWITGTAVAVPVCAELAENLIIQIPEQGIVICGAVCSFGSSPLAFDGDPAAWADTLDTVLTYGSTFIPGHGPVGTADDVRNLQAYLRACVAAGGDLSRLGSGPWDTWTDRHYDLINVQRAHMLANGDASPPPAMLQLLGLA